MSGNDLFNKINYFNALFLQLKAGSVKNASSELYGKLFYKILLKLSFTGDSSLDLCEKIRYETPEPLDGVCAQLGPLVDLACQAIDPKSDDNQKMSALIAIQDEITRSKLKAYGLEATAGLAKIVVGFLCAVWAVLCVGVLGAFYVGTAFVGMHIDSKLGNPVSSTFFHLAKMPYSAFESRLFPKNEKDHFFPSVQQEKEKSRTLQKFKNAVGEGDKKDSQHSISQLK